VPYGAAPAALRAVFASRLGAVESVHVVRDKATGLPSGSAFVKLAAASAVDAALAATTPFALDGRELSVRAEQP